MEVVASLKVAQLLRSAACLHTNQSRSYSNHLLYYREVYIVVSANKGKYDATNILKTGECEGNSEIQMKLIHNFFVICRYKGRIKIEIKYCM